MQLSWLEEPQGAIDASELERAGVLHERLELSPDNFQPVLDRLKAERGYVQQDEVKLQPDTPNLQSMCDQFKDEHLHTDDEVRFVLDGEGIFDIRSADDRWMRVVVEQGDLVVLPANVHHRFFLTDKKSIHCVRLFTDASGWVPHYRREV